jgi:hypothetical protein
MDRLHHEKIKQEHAHHVAAMLVYRQHLFEWQAHLVERERHCLQVQQALQHMFSQVEQAMATSLANLGQPAPQVYQVLQIDTLAPHVTSEFWQRVTSLADAGPPAISAGALKELEMAAFAAQRHMEGKDQVIEPEPGQQQLPQQGAQAAADQVTFLPQGPSLLDQVMFRTSGNAHIRPGAGGSTDSSGHSAAAAAASSQEPLAPPQVPPSMPAHEEEPQVRDQADNEPQPTPWRTARQAAEAAPGSQVVDGKLMVLHEHGLVEFHSPAALGGYDDLGPGAVAEALANEESEEESAAEEVLMEGPPPTIARPPQVPPLALPLPGSGSASVSAAGSAAAEAATMQQEVPQSAAASSRSELLPPGAVLTEIDRAQGEHGELS